MSVGRTDTGYRTGTNGCHRMVIYVTRDNPGALKGSDRRRHLKHYTQELLFVNRTDTGS